MFIPIKTYEDNNPYDSRIVVIYKIKKWERRVIILSRFKKN
jgi:hypothetical protein